MNRIEKATGFAAMVIASSGGFLYAETGVNGTIDQFSGGADGTLVSLGVVDDLPPGIEGIAAA